MPEELFTIDEALTDPADHGSAELTPAELAAVEGMRPNLGPSAREAWTTPARQPRREPEPATYIKRTLDSIPWWHAVATPAAVVEARAALDAAIEADRAARRDFAELPAREAAERRAIGEAAVAGDVDIPELTNPKIQGERAGDSSRRSRDHRASWVGDCQAAGLRITL